MHFLLPSNDYQEHNPRKFYTSTQHINLSPSEKGFRFFDYFHHALSSPFIVVVLHSEVIPISQLAQGRFSWTWVSESVFSLAFNGAGFFMGIDFVLLNDGFVALIDNNKLLIEGRLEGLLWYDMWRFLWGFLSVWFCKKGRSGCDDMKGEWSIKVSCTSTMGLSGMRVDLGIPVSFFPRCRPIFLCFCILIFLGCN